MATHDSQTQEDRRGVADASEGGLNFSPESSALSGINER